MVAIDALKDETVIVFISGLDLHLTPEVVQEAMASEEAFGPTPIVAVFDPQVQTTLGIVDYYSMKDVDGFAKVKTAIADFRGEAEEKAPMVRYQPETWQDKRGRTIQATYVTSSESDVTLRLSNGKAATIGIDTLSETSQARVKEIAGGSQ